MNEGFDDAHELKDLRASRIIKVGFEKTSNRGMWAKVNWANQCVEKVSAHYMAQQNESKSQKQVGSTLSDVMLTLRHWFKENEYQHTEVLEVRILISHVSLPLKNAKVWFAAKTSLTASNHN